MNSSPPFGQADLTNCERELIHLAGSVQPHGVLVVVRARDLVVVQVSRNAGPLLGLPPERLVQHPLTVLGAGLADRVQVLTQEQVLAEPVAIQCQLETTGGAPRPFEGTVHRLPDGLVLIELEPVLSRPEVDTVELPGPELLAQVEAAVQRFNLASTIPRLAEAAVKSYRQLVGYDRVMVYRFDPDGHGLIIAEARDERLDSLLGHHYPATDIPQRARELYLRNKLRVLVDVHYTPSPLEPRHPSEAGQELDMSMSYLRSMSPLHLQYLKNMGVTATLVVSLVREGKLWGLIACHHYSRRNLRLSVRAAADLMAEMISTRLAAIESYAQTQVSIQVRRLEQRLIEATSTEGDWRTALLRNPRNLMQPLDATGAALFYEGESFSTGDVPSTPELRGLVQWISKQPNPDFYATNAIANENPALGSLTSTASGVLAVRLSSARPDYLLWFRPEQLQTLTWAGDPSKPMINNDPLELSPRRSFAAWSEIVRGTAVRWSDGELATARALGNSLINIIVQINAVRVLIADQHLAQVRAVVAASKEPVVIIDHLGALLFGNDGFLALSQREALGERRPVRELFAEPGRIDELLHELSSERQSWRGELALAPVHGVSRAVSVRAEVVPARDGSVMGYFMLLDDLTGLKHALAARKHLEDSLALVKESSKAAAHSSDPDSSDGLMSAILSNASLAAMDIADAGATTSAAPMLRDLEASTHRATVLYRRIRDFADPWSGLPD